MTVQILNGDCRQVLRSLPDRSVHCAVSSPPYFGLRDYGVDGQIGLELSHEDYIAQIVAVFREVRRVLRDDGTLWLNIGDTANNRRRIRTTSHQPSLNGFKEPTWAEATKLGLTRLSVTNGDLKEKDMFGIPWLVALALRADGWYLRQEFIWRKNFGKPEPSADRLPARHEQLFLLTKSKTYHFDKDAAPAYAKGSVWDVPPKGRSDHGASFAEALVEACVLIGCPKGATVLDPFGGSGTTGAVAGRLGRNAILIELNPDFAATAKERITGAGPLFAGSAA
jgi:site-specific DNA-methyltransferase (adenine-specific)